jgi:hypothetical protein
MSRSSVFHYKGRDVDPQAAARDLKVEGVITGRIVQRGDQLIISAGAASETGDISSLQEEVDEQERPEDRAQELVWDDRNMRWEQFGLSPDAPTLTKLARQRYRRDEGWTT